MFFPNLKLKAMTKFDFHIRKAIREKYKIEDSLFTINGDLIIANFHTARVLSNKINEQRKAEGRSDQLISPGQLNAVGLMHEIFHFLIRYYEENENPGVIARSISYLNSNIGEDELNRIFLNFIIEFPPQEVLKTGGRPEDYLEGYTAEKSNKEIILEELILLHLENINTAASKFEELYSDILLHQNTKYGKFLENSEKFFSGEKPFGSENLPLLTFLKRPILSSPYSLEGQLEYMIHKWNIYIKDQFGDRILSSRDLMLEDLRLFIQFGGGKPTPSVPVYEADEEYLRRLKLKLAAGKQLTEEESRFYYSEIEKFTQDVEWMPKVVMIAKNVFVWLDQLSKKYSREIKHLDQIPDEELDSLANWNFTALWLIGIWERSSASRKIKQLTGNPEAASSAYSLYDYIIAYELGGEEAFQNLKTRAWKRGIRLASDMVPNHTGIYSRWVVENPEYFIQANYSPYPSYTFNGPNLSEDYRVEVRIEDKYYTREDAAVVFQRRDAYTGDVKYIYHGNDGTHMPWNDTAQLNLLKPEVRESLIQTILHVARKFSIIRFDAAMTLTKKHYQRLWFPKPGSGGDIPSRSDYAMSAAAFDNSMPDEFWREVVDRINSEMPETLLLAEAFWLMEGYFVRTLGMHRVYNSAFMHMLMKEENNKYRELIKNTLDFNPEILKRYVNFMSNPDEETAVNQFGKGDKYFGTAVMMVTLPGLPMFGHGQIEGLSEKYGMEYKRAYYNEFPDEYLVRRHEAEIFPLIKKRHLFSQVVNFEFYDFYNEHGTVNENVFAFTNKSGGEKALVIYNNSYGRTNGGINYCVSKINGEEKRNHKRLSEALELKNNFGIFYVFRNHINNLEYIISGRQVFDNGMYFALNGFEYRVLLDFKEFYDDTGDYEKLSNELNGSGVPSIEFSLKEIKLKPFTESLKNLFDKIMLDEFKAICLANDKSAKQKIAVVKDEKNKVKLSRLASDRLNNFLNQLKIQTKLNGNNEEVIKKITDFQEYTGEYFTLWRKLKKTKPVPKYILNIENKLLLNNQEEQAGNLDTYLIAGILKIVLAFTENLNNILFDKLFLKDSITEILKNSSHKLDDIDREVYLVKIFISRNELPGMKLFLKEITPDVFISNLLGRKDICDYIFLNEFEGVFYYNKERFENLIRWLFNLALLNFGKDLVIENLPIDKKSAGGIKKKYNAANDYKKFIKEAETIAAKILDASDASVYKVKDLKIILSS